MKHADWLTWISWEIFYSSYKMLAVVINVYKVERIILIHRIIIRSSYKIHLIDHRSRHQATSKNDCR